MGLIAKITAALIVLLVCSCVNNNKRFLPAAKNDSVYTTVPDKNNTKIDTARLNADEQIITVPEMTIKYGAGLDVTVADDGQVYYIPLIMVEFIKPGASNWSYFNGKNIISTASSSTHPLDNNTFLPKIENTNKIRLSFTYPPHYYTVRYWSEHYRGDNSAFEKYFQTIEVTDDILVLPTEESGFIFEIKAVWESVNGIQDTQGNAHYSFLYKRI